MGIPSFIVSVSDLASCLTPCIAGLIVIVVCLLYCCCSYHLIISIRNCLVYFALSSLCSALRVTDCKCAGLLFTGLVILINSMCLGLEVRRIR